MFFVVVSVLSSGDLANKVNADFYFFYFAALLLCSLFNSFLCIKFVCVCTCPCA